MRGLYIFRSRGVVLMKLLIRWTFDSHTLPTRAKETPQLNHDGPGQRQTSAISVYLISFSIGMDNDGLVKMCL